MTRSLIIEDESGTCRGHVHPHNGYYAGDFSTTGASAPSHPTVVVDLRGDNAAAVAAPIGWQEAA